METQSTSDIVYLIIGKLCECNPTDEILSIIRKPSFSAELIRIVSTLQLSAPTQAIFFTLVDNLLFRLRAAIHFARFLSLSQPNGKVTLNIEISTDGYCIQIIQIDLNEHAKVVFEN